MRTPCIHELHVVGGGFVGDAERVKLTSELAPKSRHMSKEEYLHWWGDSMSGYILALHKKTCANG